MLVVIAVVLGAGTPAQALGAEGCGSRCDGRDPHTYYVDVYPTRPEFNRLCESDARNQKTALLPSAVGNLGVVLRYSPYCRTAWAKPTYTSSPDGAYYVWVESYTSASVSSSTFRRAYTNSGRCYWGGCPSGEYLGYLGPWSYMVNDAGLYARACIRQYGDEEHFPNQYTTVCTGLY